MIITEEMKTLSVDEISPNPYQPRKYFNQGKLKILSDSIKEHGVETPIQLIWKPGNNGKKAIMKDGERRFRAIKLAGIKTLHYGDDYIFSEINNEDELEMRALIANCLHEDHSPIEKAKALMNLLKRRGIKSRKVATSAVSRAKDFIDNDFLTEPNGRNYFVPKETIKEIAGDMKAVGISGTNFIVLISLLGLPDNIQQKIQYTSPNTRIWREKVKLNRMGKMLKRDKNNQETVIPVSHAKQLARLKEDRLIRFFLRKAIDYRWTSKRLADMVADFLSSQLSADQYIRTYGKRMAEGAAQKANTQSLTTLANGMDRMASTLTSVRTVNLVAMAPEFHKKNVAISATGLKKSSENLIEKLDELLFNAVQLQKIKDKKREMVSNTSFKVLMTTSPHKTTPSYRFSIPIDVGKALVEQHGLQAGDILELKAISVIKKGIVK